MAGEDQKVARAGRSHVPEPYALARIFLLVPAPQLPVTEGLDREHRKLSDFGFLLFLALLGFAVAVLARVLRRVERSSV